MNEDTYQWTCPWCGHLNTELSETVMPECEQCGEAYDPD